MNNQEGLAFVQTYFEELFVRRNIDALDLYLANDYFDDDISGPTIDHIKNSKEFLAELFKERPTIGVDVKDAITQGSVISAFIEWYVQQNDNRKIIRKGIAIFVVNNQRSLKRHTSVYYEE